MESHLLLFQLVLYKFEPINPYDYTMTASLMEGPVSNKGLTTGKATTRLVGGGAGN